MILFMLLLSGCAGEEWEGNVYPDRDNLLIHRSAGRFYSLEACRKESSSMLGSLSEPMKGYYECGKNCKTEAGYYAKACEDTLRYNH